MAPSNPIHVRSRAISKAENFLSLLGDHTFYSAIIFGSLHRLSEALTPGTWARWWREMSCLGSTPFGLRRSANRDASFWLLRTRYALRKPSRKKEWAWVELNYRPRCAVGSKLSAT